jgi:acetoin utilization deacetylase AcuC-like enzyme
MKVIFHEAFYDVYTDDPASSEGRMEAIVEVIGANVDMVTAVPASKDQIAAAHAQQHIDHVKKSGLYAISSLAAGGAIQTARIGLSEPAFGLIRPPGHHASQESSWGFCYFNNMAVALLSLRSKGLIKTAAKSCGGGCFAILEGGYNHDVLGHNVAALLEGLSA